MARRKWTPWEQRMVGEWVSRTFGDVRYQTNVRLGKIQPRTAGGQFTEEELSMTGVWRRFVDAVVWLPDRLILVEAALRADPGKLGQLELYRTLVPQTPELQDYRKLPIQLVFVYCIEDPAVNSLARVKGILPVLFLPTFYEEWLSTLPARKKRAPGLPPT
jgi:hypothetical protein